MYSSALRIALFTQNMNHHITNEEAQTLKINECLKLRLRLTYRVKVKARSY